jgi:hypothetical protein
MAGNTERKPTTAAVADWSALGSRILTAAAFASAMHQQEQANSTASADLPQGRSERMRSWPLKSA